ncbi:MAG TPA: MopE-related protein, partial [Myxococcota bacterium]|nr:MopE-related protein [Myxococcota bacterium]
DLLLSAVRDDDGGNNAGAAYVIYGNTAAYFDGLDDDGVIDLTNAESFGRIAEGDPDNFPTYSASNLGGPEAAKILGLASTDNLGRSVAGRGDFDGDGRPDLAVGATQVDDGDRPNAGAAYVMVGGPYGTDDDAPLGDRTSYYWDSDADAYANEAGDTFVTCPMHAPISFKDPSNPKLRGIPVASAPPLDDCDDANDRVHPNASEVSNDGVDSDCDGYDNANRDPIVSVALNPSTAYTDTALTAVVTGTDPDGDVLSYTYLWRVDGAEVVGQTTDSLASTFFDKDEIVQVTVMVDDGRETTGPFTASVTVRNSKPTLTSCAIWPSVGGTTVDWAAQSVGLNDADPEDVGLLTTSVRWEKRFGPLWRAIPGATAGTLDSCIDRYSAGSIYNCVRGDQLRAVCQAFDTYELGSEYASDPIVIANEPPTVTQCSLSPSAPDTLTDVTVTAAGQDPDNDSLTFAYVWLRNGVEDLTITGTTWPSSKTDHFDSIQVRCTVTDSQGASSSPVSSTPIIIVNTPPTAPVIDLTPNAPRSNQNLLVTVTTPSTDVDGDTVTYDLYWTKDGDVFPNPTSPTTTTTLDKSATRRGETWEVTAVANDGYATGGSDSDFVVIQNTPPTVESAVLLPSAPTTATDVRAFGINFYDEDGDPEDYVISWYVNGTLQSAQTPDPMVLSNAAIVRGNTVYAVLTARDPFTTGNTVTSPTVTVVNAKPTAPTLAITPVPPGDDDTLTCGITTASTDADGDAITLTYAWYRNGSVVGGQTASTYPAAQTSIGDVFYCTVTPHDGIEAGDAGTSPTIAIQDTNAPAAPVITSIYRYNNTTSETLTGTCVSGATDCNTLRITCNDGVAPDVYNTSCTGNAFSQVVSTDRGLTTSCSGVCIDISNNTSAASNTVTKTSCNPYDTYETSGNYGDAPTNPIAEWATLADNNSTSITILGNIVADDTVDWYRIDTSDNPVADAVAGQNAWHFEVEMTNGAADYNLFAYRNSYAGAPLCVATAPYDDFSVDVRDLGDAPNHALPGNLNACTSNGSATWSLYNECTSFASSFYIRVVREFNIDCQYYQLRAYNGRP